MFCANVFNCSDEAGEDAVPKLSNKSSKLESAGLIDMLSGSMEELKAEADASIDKEADSFTEVGAEDEGDGKEKKGDAIAG